MNDARTRRRKSTTTFESDPAPRVSRAGDEASSAARSLGRFRALGSTVAGRTTMVSAGEMRALQRSVGNREIGRRLQRGTDDSEEVDTSPENYTIGKADGSDSVDVHTEDYTIGEADGSRPEDVSPDSELDEVQTDGQRYDELERPPGPAASSDYDDD